MKKNILKFYISLFIALLGCSDNEDFSNLISQPEIVSGLSVKSSYLVGQNIEFNIYDENQNDITDLATFFIDGMSILENEITHNSVGSHNVSAEYTLDGQLYVTEEMVYSVVNPINKLLMEDFTGTWCGYCPPVKYAIEQALEIYPNNISVVATHQNDEFALAEEQELTTVLGPFGLPEARLNRTTEWMQPYNLEVLDNLVNFQNNLAISVNSSVQNGSLDVNIRFVSSEPLIDHKLVVYVTENGLIADQSNYLNFDESSYFYGMGNPIVDYVHNDVLRHSLTNILGDNFDDTESFEDTTKNFSLDISNLNIQFENSSIIAFIVDSENTTINSQFAMVGEFQDFN